MLSLQRASRMSYGLLRGRYGGGLVQLWSARRTMSRKGGDVGEEWEWDPRVDSKTTSTPTEQEVVSEEGVVESGTLRGTQLPLFEIEGGDGAVDYVPEAHSFFEAVDDLVSEPPLTPSERAAALRGARTVTTEDAAALARALDIPLPRREDTATDVSKDHIEIADDAARHDPDDVLSSLAPERIGARRAATPPAEEKEFEKHLQTDLRFLEAAGLREGNGESMDSRPIRAMPLWMLYEVAAEDDDDDGDVDGAGGDGDGEVRGKVGGVEQTLLRRAMVDKQGRAWGVGRRKSAHANVSVQLGDGDFRVNRKPLAEYFSDMDLRREAIAPLVVLRACGAFDVQVTVKGGGVSGQAAAIKLGVARALANFDPYLRPKLKSLKLLQRDPRVVERKKPGQKKARKKFQWVKR